MSDCDRHAVVAIAMLGNVFSPFYARARRADPARDPLEHAAMSFALYGPRGQDRWALTERGRDEARRARTTLTIGRSSLAWHDGALVAQIDERTAPFAAGVRAGERVRGTLRILPEVTTAGWLELDALGLHRWWPIAPAARIEVDLDEPRLRWSGRGYLDANCGDEPLEQGFRGWSWMRAALPQGGALVTYDATLRDGRARSLSRVILPDGQVAPLEHRAPWGALPSGAWGVPRQVRADGPRDARLVKSLEDTPFYTRSIVDTSVAGQRVRAMHETVDLERFSRAWVQFLLPFRMRRAS